MDIHRELPHVLWNNDVPGQLVHYAFQGLPHRLPYLPLLARTEHFPGGHDSGLHQPDDFCVLQFAAAGQGVHLVGGRGYNLMSGDAYFLAPGSNHGFLHYSGVLFHSLYFPLDLLSKAEAAALRGTHLWKVLAPVGRRRRANPITRRLHLQPDQFRIATHLLLEINDELRRPPIGIQLARLTVFRLLALLARWFEERPAAADLQAETTRASTGDRTASLAEVIDYCEKNLARPLNVKQLAARMGLSRSQFTRVFTRSVGMSPAAYTRQLRLAHAQYLLVNTDIKMEEIAPVCGLLDATSLSRTFHAAFGMTPSAYRRAYRGR